MIHRRASGALRGPRAARPCRAAAARVGSGRQRRRRGRRCGSVAACAKAQHEEGTFRAPGSGAFPACLAPSSRTGARSILEVSPTPRPAAATARTICRCPHTG
eukprot:3978148-Prymnesium_polylepis.2